MSIMTHLLLAIIKKMNKSGIFVKGGIVIFILGLILILA